MRFYTVEIQGKEVPALSADGGKTAFTFETLGESSPDMAAFLREGAQEKTAALKEAAGKAAPEKAFSLENAKILAPIVRPDQDVICLGINYDEHATEAGRFSKEAFGGERPYTIYFSKRVSRAAATNETIPAYEGLVDSLDYETELGVILGKDTKGVREEEAEKNVFGYTIINDISARNLQTRHKQWYLGKSLDGFTPIGPCIVTPDELGNAGELDISCTVNGQLRQNSNTRYMIQTVKGAISELSAGMTLKAGTVISMGTPAGVGMGMTPPTFLKKGDRIVCHIQGIGDLVNMIG